MPEICEELPIPDDTSCIKHGTHFIEKILYTNAGDEQEIVVPALSQGQTMAQAIAIVIATRMALTDDDPLKIHSFETKKGLMPEASPVYKTDPHRNINVLSEIDTKMKFEWVDYVDNDERYEFLKKLNDAGIVKAWGLAGKKLIGGLKGLDGSFNTLSSIKDDGTMPSSIKAEFNWAGHPMPDRVTIA